MTVSHSGQYMLRVLSQISTGMRVVRVELGKHKVFRKKNQKPKHNRINDISV